MLRSPVTCHRSLQALGFGLFLPASRLLLVPLPLTGFACHYNLSDLTPDLG